LEYNQELLTVSSQISIKSVGERWMATEATRTPIEGADDLDILSAIWILSCNDENPTITYRGITGRLGLSDTFDVRALVRSRSELFRPGILNSRLDAWKKQMKSGKSRPAWITEIRNKVEQENAIDKITRDDVFRNQFRIEAEAQKCELQIIDWGLNHIERLRKSAAEEREAKSKKWGTVIIPLASLLVAGLSVFGSVAVQWVALREQRELKKYEVSFKPKQESYSTFMGAFMKAAISAEAGDEPSTLQEVTRMEANYYLFEPFLSDAERRRAFDEFNKFATICNQMVKMSKTERLDKKEFYEEDVSKLAASKAYFRDPLYAALFSKLD
jgi:hypothetical protein